MKWKWWMGPLMDGEPGTAGGGDTHVEGAPPEPDPELTAIKQNLGSVADQVTRLTRAFQNQPVVPPPSPQPTNQPTKEDLDREFFKNPVGMTAAIVQKGIQEAVAQANSGNYDTLVAVARSQARGSDPEQQALFDKYLGEIEAKIAQVHPQFRTNVTVWINAFNNVKGERLADIIRESKPDTQKAPAVHIKDGPRVPSSAPAPAPKVEPLSDEEKAIAKKLRLTEDEYRHGKENYHKQDDLGESSWDEYLTFDSTKADKERRRKVAAGAK